MNYKSYILPFVVTTLLCIRRDLQKGACARRTLLMLTAALGCGGGRGGSSGGASPSSTLVHMAMDAEMEVRL